jgi:hypothetical protein
MRSREINVAVHHRLPDTLPACPEGGLNRMAMSEFHCNWAVDGSSNSTNSLVGPNFPS